MKVDGWHMDTIDKIVESYFFGLTSTPFSYKNKEYTPKLLRVSPKLLRGFTCPAMCAGCCGKVFTLDYLPNELHPYKLEKRIVEFNNKKFPIYTDFQKGNTGTHCKHVDMSNGRCMIHGKHPFSCDFELIRFMIGKEQNQMMTRLYGRGWNMLRVDDERGALCEIIEKRNPQEILRKLNRLKKWTDHFELETKLPKIIKHIETSLFTEPLFL